MHSCRYAGFGRQLRDKCWMRCTGSLSSSKMRRDKQFTLGLHGALLATLRRPPRAGSGRCELHDCNRIPVAACLPARPI